MIAYAARDVFYLIQLAAELRDELKIKGRLSWVTEECEELSKVRAMPPDNALLFLKIRGAGKSQGEHSEGEGEQEDVNSAVSYLRSLGITRISLAGYFFGAWVNGLAAGKCGEIED